MTIKFNTQNLFIIQMESLSFDIDKNSIVIGTLVFQTLLGNHVQIIENFNCING